MAGEGRVGNADDRDDQSGLPPLSDRAPKLDPAPFADQFASALDAGDVAVVQLRLKDVDEDAWAWAIDVLRPVTQSRGVAFLLNDRADLVHQTGSDGAHVGQEDLPAKDARRLMGAPTRRSTSLARVAAT